MAKKMKIAFVSRQDVNDITSWSGTNYHMYHALKMICEKRGISIYVIDKLIAKRNIVIKILEKIYNVIWVKTFQQLPNGIFYRATVKSFARQIKKKLQKDTDIIFSLTVWPLAYLKLNKTKVFYTDSDIGDFMEMSSLYVKHSKQWQETAIELQEKSINNSDLALLASEWAAEGLIKRHKLTNTNKVKIIPFGINMECTRTKNDIEEMLVNKKGDVCNLLFVGVDWLKKGGNIALETARILHEKGIRVHLDIVGIKNCPVELPNYVENHGFIFKSTKVGMEKLDYLFKNAHFFILPTQIEAYGIVYAEASSYGIPSLASSVGGVPCVVIDGLNGKLFSLSDNGDKYAEYIQTMLSNYEDYKNLCFSSFERYEQCLNWKIACENILGHIEKVRK